MAGVRKMTARRARVLLFSLLMLIIVRVVQFSLIPLLFSKTHKNVEDFEI